MPALSRFVRFIILLLLFPCSGYCQLQPAIPQWVDDLGGPGSSSISSFMKVDAQNNIYVTGYFSGTVDFDPSPTITKKLTSRNGSIDIFIAKYDTNGALIWVVSVGGDDTDTPNGLDFDSNGNISITGLYVSSLMDADPGPGTHNLVNAGGSDTFIIHVDKNGNFLWAKTLGGTNTDFGSKVTNDHNDNVIVASQFQANILGVPGITSGLGATDGLITKYDASGNQLWAFNLGAPGGGDNSTIGVLADANNNLVVTGYLNGTVNFNPLGIPDNITGYNSTYVAQYSPSGILIWLKTISGSKATNIGIDAANNIYAEGLFSSSASFQGGSTLNANGNQDVFFCKYSSTGLLQWAKNIGGAGSRIANYGIASSPNGDIYLSGYFSGLIDFDPSANTAIVKDHGTQDLFLAKYDANGIYQWAFGAGNSSCGNTLARYVTVNNNNEVILTGSFCSTVNFDVSGCTTYSLTATGSPRDFFLAKYVPEAPPISGNTITAPAVTSFCQSDDPDKIAGSIPVGGNNIFTYQWQNSADGVNFSNINDQSSNSVDYNPPLLSVTTYFRRSVKTSDCQIESISNIIEIDINNETAITNADITPPAITKFCNTTLPADPDVINGDTPSGGSGSPSYRWQSSTDNSTFIDIGGETSANLNPGPINVTTYYRRITTMGNCVPPFISSVVTINVESAVAATDNIILSPPESFCAVSAVRPPIEASEPKGGAGNYKYQWQESSDNITFANISGANSMNLDAKSISSTTYYRRVVTSGVCSIPSTSNVLAVIVSPPITDNKINEPNITTFCGQGDAASITGSAIGNNVKCQWQSSTDNVTFTDIPGAIATDFDPQVSNITIYYRRILYSDICVVPSVSNIITITINDIPKVTLSSSETICLGSSVVLNASGGASYSWSPAIGLSDTNVASPTANPTVTTTYTVTVTDNDCSSSAQVTVTVIPPPVVDAGQDQDVFKGDKIQLNGKVSQDGVLYSWSPATYLDNPNILNPVATPLDDITYTLTVTSAQNCFIVKDNVSLKVYEHVIIPNAFTPNNDGINDTWNIPALKSYNKCEVKVFNRNGAMIFESIGYQKPWDGTYGTGSVPFGTYYYIIDLKNNSKPISGWVSIIR